MAAMMAAVMAAMMAAMMAATHATTTLAPAACGSFGRDKRSGADGGDGGDSENRLADHGSLSSGCWMCFSHPVCQLGERPVGFDLVRRKATLCDRHHMARGEGNHRERNQRAFPIPVNRRNF
jgi:hypothetical protein